jgi:TolB-like protein/Tfp pilus assembly protein PilF
MASSTCHEEDTARQLDRVLSSAGFARNERMSRFLRLLVERHLAGRDDELKESLIGVEVFGRRPDFDPKQDSIVRTEAGRLRARLTEYYAGDGRDDAIVIELPKGGYVPTVRRVTADPPAVVVPARRGPRRAGWAAASLAVLVLAGGSAFWWLRASENPGETPPIPIAVLPLESLSGDQADTYFADGLTDEIIRNLSGVDGLAVRSRTSSFVFKSTPRNVRDVGRQLRADYLVEGSILRDGDRLRVNARLIRVSDDLPVWSDRFDRELTDVFAIQNEIARGIVNQLRLNLGRGGRHETSVEAYDLYLRARTEVAARGILGAIESIPAFERVVVLDPAFAPAYAELGSAYALRSVQFPVDHPADELDRMRTMADTAVKLDPLLADAHAALGLAHARGAAWERAAERFRRAIELDPNSSRVRGDFAMWVLHVTGRNDEALEQLRAAEASDPLSPDVHLATAWVLMASGRFDEAAAHCDAIREGHSLKRQCAGRVRLGTGDIEGAARIFAEEARARTSPQSSGFLGYVLARTGRRDEAERMWAASIHPNEQALISAGLRDVDRTVDALEGMAAVGAQRIGQYLNYPEMAFLRDNARVSALRRRVGLPE